MLGHTSIIYPSNVYYILDSHKVSQLISTWYVGIICIILHSISTVSMLRMVTWICWWPTTVQPMAPFSPTLSVAAKWKQPSLHAMCWLLASHRRKWKQEMLHQVGGHTPQVLMCFFGLVFGWVRLLGWGCFYRMLIGCLLTGKFFSDDQFKVISNSRWSAGRNSQHWSGGYERLSSGSPTSKNDRPVLGGGFIFFYIFTLKIVEMIQFD